MHHANALVRCPFLQMQQYSCGTFTLSLGGQAECAMQVCRHHAAAVASGQGHCTQFRCPYHGWTYSLEGRLVKAIGLKGIQDFKARDYGLVPMAAATWGHLVFIQPRLPASSR